METVSWLQKVGQRRITDSEGDICFVKVIIIIINYCFPEVSGFRKPYQNKCT